ncbi:salicylate synthase [Burkholderia humptydooensis]|uniref:AMP-dependent synthetase and ligase n=1 Tax=Burkholderia humptydooensis MSMB43 TaxID=441157 RepID=A0ABN0FZC1_9BURK|nr:MULTISPECIES: salicylate synthase [Burkholderia]AJY38737.1 salicylate synthase [Burkholderia sp. 2002721687]ALX44935.1 AMP-dependent synthetase [Burkholderia humptydooensis]EIP85251.1 AMP-dependent synthetase and ligase [Burkholderia humptydooensis MSMB43]
METLLHPNPNETADAVAAEPDISSAALPLGEHLRRWAADHATRTALVAGGERVPFVALDHRVDRLAAALHELGLRPGDRAMVQLPNGIAFVTVCFALFRLGVVPVLAMPTQRSHDIDALCRIAEPSAYFIADGTAGFDARSLAADMLDAHPSLRWIVVDGEPGRRDNDDDADERVVPLASLDAPPRALTPPAPNDVALLLLSGGTTGTPKLIPRTHADYAYNFSASAALCGLDDTSVYLAVLPAAHNFTLACPGILGTLASGGAVVLSDTASCDEAMPLIARERVTHVALVPPLAQLWAQAREWERSDLSSLRLVQVGGARLDPALARRLPDVLGCRLQQVFGMAEGLLCYTRLDDPPDTIAHTQGRPLSPRDEVRIVDAHGRDVAAGDVGELLTRGPYTIRGYYRAPEHNARSFTGDGYYRTGDLVRRDAAGNLIVEGRIKEQINRGGEKISAAEIELLIDALPDVQDSAVVAVPDALLGERICAFVRPQRDALDAATLKQALRARGLSEFKLPDQIEIAAHWPLTSVGKIDKQRLIAIAKARDAAPARRYVERHLSVRSEPLDLASRIMRALPSRHCTLYERGGEWSIGIDSALSVIVEPDGTVRRSDGASWRDAQPCDAIAHALADVRIDAWRAYGRAHFEFSHLTYGIDGARGDEPLLRLAIPQSEIRVSSGRALIRSLDPGALATLAELVDAQDAAQQTEPGARLETIDGERDARAYKEQVASAVREMQADAYQKVILSRAVEVPASLDTVSSYVAGRRTNTPARSFLLRDGDFEAYGFSPETVVEVSADGFVSTQPLAGTRALTGDDAEDARLRRELLRDAKEIAEHAVSVQLAMDEMSSICDADTLGVSEFMNVYRRGTVQHLASRVRGRLAAGRHAWHAFEKLFPAVTASGIPKREALDSIRRHEQRLRGLYSGCVFVVDSEGAMDAALVLRSVYRDGERCWLQAGAGLVPLSTPDREWTETCEKLASVARHLQGRAGD